MPLLDKNKNNNTKPASQSVQTHIKPPQLTTSANFKQLNTDVLIKTVL